MTNKESTMLFLKALALFLWAMIVIITCSAVWNSKPSVFIGIVAGLCFAINGFCIYWCARRISKRDE